MASGGTTAFANKMGKNFQAIGNQLKRIPKDAFLTQEEADASLKMLNESR